MANPNLETLHTLKSTDAPLWLAPNPSLSQTARIASQHLFSFLKPFSPKSPFDQLLIDGFDAEQIWQQIDLQSQPLLSTLRREVKKLEKKPVEIEKIQRVLEDKRNAIEGGEKVIEEENKLLEEDSGGFGEELDGFDEDDEENEEGEKESEEEEEEEEEGVEEQGGGGGIEDGFLKIKELEEYLQEDEAREYGLKKKNKNDNERQNKSLDEEEEDEDEDEDEEDEDGEYDELDDDDDEGMDKLENVRYEDFFGSKKKIASRKKSKLIAGMDDEEDDDEDGVENQGKGDLSTHEKEREKLQSKIEQMEKANLEPKTWTMQGEITAAKRPKNSALEVDLDFEHNVRPAPVITEEVTASLEELIQKRIIEERFDDVQKPPSLPSKAPREYKELDDNKSKKGLAEVYEEEYVQKTNISSAILPFSDEQKKEASSLFKNLCLKLDALSHFHFSAKPVIEDMSIQTNVPALAMEEIAPMAVSDAAMLAPEEVFSGKGDIKEEAELTQEEKKRRRANKKRKFKVEAAKRMPKKARDSALLNHDNGKEEKSVIS